MKSYAQEAVAERAAGGRPGRVRSTLAALAIGFATGVATYHLLRDDD